MIKIFRLINNLGKSHFLRGRSCGGERDWISLKFHCFHSHRNYRSLSLQRYFDAIKMMDLKPTTKCRRRQNPILQLEKAWVTGSGARLEQVIIFLLDRQKVRVMVSSVLLIVFPKKLSKIYYNYQMYTRSEQVTKRLTSL